jgi:hypothetical protein
VIQGSSSGGSMEVGMFLTSVSEQRFESNVGNQILYQVVGGEQSTGPMLNLNSRNSLELLENGVGERRFRGSKFRRDEGKLFEWRWVCSIFGHGVLFD